MNVRRFATASGLALSVAIGFPAAAWAVSFGSMGAYEDGIRLAESSGGSVTGGSTSITETITFRDLRADGDGAYGVARHQAYQNGCNPGTQVCYYAWRAVYTAESARYGTASGWITSTMSESGHGAADWRTQPGICVDQSFEPDACAWKSYINP